MARPGEGPTGGGADQHTRGDQRRGLLDGEPFVRLLGPVQYVLASGVCLDLPSVTQRQVLAALALDPGTAVRPELLCERLGLSAGALRTTVSRVRGRLGGGVIATDALGYRITGRTDAAVFESLLLDRGEDADRIGTLRAALDLWMGPALDEFRHDAWSAAPVFRLDELHDLAVEELAEALIETGRGGEAVAVLQAHVADHPWRDRARGLLVRALASVGRRAEALRAYQDYRRFLAEETGTEPSAEVTRIERRVASGWDGFTLADGSSRPADPEAAEERGRDLPPPLASGLDGGVVGRRTELDALRAELDAVVAGRGARGALVSGAAGIGKTTLVTAFAQAVHEAGTATVLYGRCPDGASDPMQPFRAVVTSVVAAAPVEVLAAHALRCGGELQRIAPGIARRTWVPQVRHGDEATERHQLFEGVADLLSRAAALEPLVVVLEDLHWAQPTALGLMRHLVGELGSARILLVATVRDEATGRSDEVRATVAELERAGIRRVVLGGLDDGELASLVASVVGSVAPVEPELIDAMRFQTAGNPLYASQLARHLADAGGIVADDRSVRMAGPLDGARVPASLADLVWARVCALGGAVPAVLRSASVLGTSFDPALLAELSGHAAVEVDEALWAAGHAGLLEDEAPAERVRFVHGLVARSLYDELEPAERRRLHRCAADLIERGDEHLRLSTVVQLAHHRASAGDRADAQRWAALAGDRSLAQLSSTEAAQWYATALEHAHALERPGGEVAGLLVKLAIAQHRSGQLGAAAASVREASALARQAGATEVIVDAALAGDRGHVSATTVDSEQLDLVESALAVVRPDDVGRRARLLAQHAQELVHTDRFVDRERSARAAIELAEQSDDPTLLAQLVSPISFGLWGLGSLGLRANLADRASAAARHSADPLVHFAVSRSNYIVAIESADADLAAASMARMRGIANRSRDPQLLWSTASYAVFEATMSASLDEAEERLERNLELGLRIGEPDALSIYGGQLFVLRSFASRYDELLALLDDLVAANAGVQAFALARAIACAATGRREVAQEVLDAGIDGGLQPSRDHYALTTLVGYAVLAVELGDERAAGVLYPVLEPYGAQATFNGATSQGPVAAYLGKLASILGRHEQADAHLHAALGMADRCGWRYHRATTLVALAISCQRATGTLDERARRWLDEACTIAASCGLDGVRAQAATVGALG